MLTKDDDAKLDEDLIPKKKVSLKSRRLRQKKARKDHKLLSVEIHDDAEADAALVSMLTKDDDAEIGTDYF